MASTGISPEDKAKDLLNTLSTSQDIVPALITDLATSLVAARANASTDEAKKGIQSLQAQYLDQCSSFLSKQLSNDENDLPTLQLQSATLKSLLRMVMDDTPFTDTFFASPVYPSILRLNTSASSTLRSASSSSLDTKDAPKKLSSSASAASTSETTKEIAPSDLKPMIIILLSKAFEMVSNKDHVRDKSTEIVLTDIGSDKLKTRVAGFQALGLIVQADMTIGAGLLNKEGLLVELMDCIELEPEEIQISLTETLSMACSDTKTRTAIGLHCGDFLKSIVHKGATKNQHLKGAAAVALTKISLAESRKDPSVGMAGLEGDSTKTGGSNNVGSAEEEANLAKLFSGLLKDDKNDNNSAIQVNAVEGLAYASIQPAVKHLIISDKALLLSLFQLAEDTKSNPLKYGLIIIFNNLTAFRKRLSPEQEQMLKLKKMAGALPKSESSRLSNQEQDDPLEDEPVVNQRNITLTKLGIMPALHAISHQASENVAQSLAMVRFQLSKDIRD